MVIKITIEPIFEIDKKYGIETKPIPAIQRYEKRNKILKEYAKEYNKAANKR